MTRDLARLRTLAEGEIGAATRGAGHELLTHARRTAAPDDLALAALAIGDADLIGEVAESLWDGDPDALEAFGRRCGFVLDAGAAARIDLLLDAAHGRRRIRLMRRATVVASIVDALTSPDGFAFRHAGESPSSPTNPQTTGCLAAPIADGRVIVGVRACGASHPSPGRCWPALAPWRVVERASNLDRLRTWLDADAQEDCTRLATVESAVIDAERERRGAVPSGPMVDLAELLEGARDARNFKNVVRLLDKWPKVEREALPDAVRLAARSLANWPNAVRVQGKAWIKRVSKGKARPSDALARRLELHFEPGATANAAVADALATTDTLMGVVDLELVGDLSPDDPGALGRTLSNPSCAQLERLTLHHPDAGQILGLEHLEALEWLRLLGGRTDGADATWSLPNVRHLEVSAALVPRIVASPAAASIRRLEVRGPTRTIDPFEALGTSEHLGALRHLTVGPVLTIGPERAAAVPAHHLAEALCGHPWPALTSLSLAHTAMTTRGLRVLLDHSAFPALTRLDLAATRVGGDGLRLLAEHASARGLRELTIGSQIFGQPSQTVDSEAFTAFVGSETMAAMEILQLTSQPLGDAGAIALAESGASSRLRWLNLRACQIGEAGARALAESPHLHALEVLVLDGNPLGASGLGALLGSAHLPNLVQLSASRCEASADAFVGLEETGALPALEELFLSGNPVKNAGARALATAPSRDALRWVRLDGCGISKKGVPALEASWLAGRFTGPPGANAAGWVARHGWAADAP